MGLYARQRAGSENFLRERGRLVKEHTSICSLGMYTTCDTHLTTLCFAVVHACYLLCSHNQHKRSEMAVAGGCCEQAAMTKNKKQPIKCIP